MKNENDLKGALSKAAAAAPSAPGHRPALTLDVALYEQYLAGSDLTETQKCEFVETLWSIIVAFVDLGFGVHPLQQASDACGQIGDIGDFSGMAAAGLIECGDETNRQFENAAEGVAAFCEERSPE